VEAIDSMVSTFNLAEFGQATFEDVQDLYSNAVDAISDTFSSLGIAEVEEETMAVGLEETVAGLEEGAEDVENNAMFLSTIGVRGRAALDALLLPFAVTFDKGISSLEPKEEVEITENAIVHQNELPISELPESELEDSRDN